MKRLSFIVLVFCGLVAGRVCGQAEKDSLIPEKIDKQKIVGHYEGKEPYCRSSVKIKGNHKIITYRKCEANKGYTKRAKWKIVNDTILVFSKNDRDNFRKWILIKGCIYELKEKNDETLIGCKDD